MSAGCSYICTVLPYSKIAMHHRRLENDDIKIVFEIHIIFMTCDMNSNHMMHIQIHFINT